MKQHFVKDMLADYVVEPIKSRDVVPKTTVCGSTLAMCTHFPPKLHDITFGRCCFHFNVLALLCILVLHALVDCMKGYLSARFGINSTSDSKAFRFFYSFGCNVVSAFSSLEESSLNRIVDGDDLSCDWVSTTFGKKK